MPENSQEPDSNTDHSANAGAFNENLKTFADPRSYSGGLPNPQTLKMLKKFTGPLGKGILITDVCLAYQKSLKRNPEVTKEGPHIARAFAETAVTFAWQEAVTRVGQGAGYVALAIPNPLTVTAGATLVIVTPWLVRKYTPDFVSEASLYAGNKAFDLASNTEHEDNSEKAPLTYVLLSKESLSSKTEKQLGTFSFDFERDAGITFDSDNGESIKLGEILKPDDETIEQWMEEEARVFAEPEPEPEPEDSEEESSDREKIIPILPILKAFWDNMPSIESKDDVHIKDPGLRGHIQRLRGTASMLDTTLRAFGKSELADKVTGFAGLAAGGTQLFSILAGPSLLVAIPAAIPVLLSLAPIIAGLLSKKKKGGQSGMETFYKLLKQQIEQLALQVGEVFDFLVTFEARAVCLFLGLIDSGQLNLDLLRVVHNRQDQALAFIRTASRDNEERYYSLRTQIHQGFLKTSIARILEAINKQSNIDIDTDFVNLFEHYASLLTTEASLGTLAGRSLDEPSTSVADLGASLDTLREALCKESEAWKAALDIFCKEEEFDNKPVNTQVYALLAVNAVSLARNAYPLEGNKYVDRQVDVRDIDVLSRIQKIGEMSEDFANRVRFSRGIDGNFAKYGEKMGTFTRLFASKINALEKEFSTERRIFYTDNTEKNPVLKASFDAFMRQFNEDEAGLQLGIDYKGRVVRNCHNDGSGPVPVSEEPQEWSITYQSRFPNGHVKEWKAVQENRCLILPSYNETPFSPPNYESGQPYSGQQKARGYYELLREVLRRGQRVVKEKYENLPVRQALSVRLGQSSETVENLPGRYFANPSSGELPILPMPSALIALLPPAAKAAMVREVLALEIYYAFNAEKSQLEFSYVLEDPERSISMEVLHVSYPIDIKFYTPREGIWYAWLGGIYPDSPDISCRVQDKGMTHHSATRIDEIWYGSNYYSYVPDVFFPYLKEAHGRQKKPAIREGAYFMLTKNPEFANFFQAVVNDAGLSLAENTLSRARKKYRLKIADSMVSWLDLREIKNISSVLDTQFYLIRAVFALQAGSYFADITLKEEGSEYNLNDLLFETAGIPFSKNGIRHWLEETYEGEGDLSTAELTKSMALMAALHTEAMHERFAASLTKETPGLLPFPLRSISNLISRFQQAGVCDTSKEACESHRKSVGGAAYARRKFQSLCNEKANKVFKNSVINDKPLRYSLEQSTNELHNLLDSLTEEELESFKETIKAGPLECVLFTFAYYDGSYLITDVRGQNATHFHSRLLPDYSTPTNTAEFSEEEAPEDFQQTQYCEGDTCGDSNTNPFPGDKEPEEGLEEEEIEVEAEEDLEEEEFPEWPPAGGPPGEFPSTSSASCSRPFLHREILLLQSFVSAISQYFSNNPEKKEEKFTPAIIKTNDSHKSDQKKPKLSPHFLDPQKHMNVYMKGQGWNGTTTDVITHLANDASSQLAFFLLCGQASKQLRRWASSCWPNTAVDENIYISKDELRLELENYDNLLSAYAGDLSHEKSQYQKMNWEWAEFMLDEQREGLKRLARKKNVTKKDLAGFAQELSDYAAEFNKAVTHLSTAKKRIKVIGSSVVNDDKESTLPSSTCKVSAISSATYTGLNNASAFFDRMPEMTDLVPQPARVLN